MELNIRFLIDKNNPYGFKEYSDTNNHIKSGKLQFHKQKSVRLNKYSQ